ARQHGLEIVHQSLIGEGLAHLLGQAGTALVIAQHAVGAAQARRDGIPAVERAAHLMQQHHRRATLAGDAVVKAYSVGGDPRQGPSPGDNRCMMYVEASGGDVRRTIGYCGSIWASRATLPHFAISFLTRAPSSSGVLPTGSAPSAASFSFISAVLS